jgi:hypothetical protein
MTSLQLATLTCSLAFSVVLPMMSKWNKRNRFSGNPLKKDGEK